MDSSSLNSPEMMDFINEEKQRAMVAEMVAKLTSVCWDKCITGTPGTCSFFDLPIDDAPLSVDEAKR